MTRPSEAIVKGPEFFDQLREYFDVAPVHPAHRELEAEAIRLRGANVALQEQLALAALSTPPLPSAEPCEVYTKEQAEAMVALALAADRHARTLRTPLPSAEPTDWRVMVSSRAGDEYAIGRYGSREEAEVTQNMWGGRIVPLYTTQLAAAQDTGPKDEAVRWLAILLAGEYDTEWQDAEGVPLPDLSQSCRDLLDAARAAGGE